MKVLIIVHHVEAWMNAQNVQEKILAPNVVKTFLSQTEMENANVYSGKMPFLIKLNQHVSAIVVSFTLLKAAGPAQKAYQIVANVK